MHVINTLYACMKSFKNKILKCKFALKVYLLEVGPTACTIDGRDGKGWGVGRMLGD